MLRHREVAGSNFFRETGSPEQGAVLELLIQCCNRYNSALSKAVFQAFFFNFIVANHLNS